MQRPDRKNKRRFTDILLVTVLAGLVAYFVYWMRKPHPTVDPDNPGGVVQVLPAKAEPRVQAIQAPMSAPPSPGPAREALGPSLRPTTRETLVRRARVRSEIEEIQTELASDPPPPEPEQIAKHDRLRELETELATTEEELDRARTAEIDRVEPSRADAAFAPPPAKRAPVRRARPPGR